MRWSFGWVQSMLMMLMLETDTKVGVLMVR